MSELVYKVLHTQDWLEAQRHGRYLGSADDARDGFIHLSTPRQLAGTLVRHFSDAGGHARPDLVLVAIDPRRLGASLRWEPARDGSLFPHLYGALDSALAVTVQPLAIGPDGRHVLTGFDSHA